MKINLSNCVYQFTLFILLNFMNGSAIICVRIAYTAAICNLRKNLIP